MPNSLKKLESQQNLGIEVPHRTAPAMLLSLALHVALLLLGGLLFSRAPQGTGASSDRPVGIAFVHRLPDRDRYEDAAAAEATHDVSPPTPENNPSADSTAAAAAPPADLSPPIDMAGLLQAMSTTPAPVAGTGLAGETSLSGDAFGSQRGKQSAASGDDASAMMFGISGSGSQFVYVMDRSDSMNGFNGRPLRAAKAELIRSLRSLSQRQRFQIIFYNDKPSPFQLSGTSVQLIPGDSPLVTVAEQYVRSIQAYGGTEHLPALQLALRMSPDVIFFMTDANIPRLTTSELAELQRRALQSGTTIHAIEFGTDAVPPVGSFLRDLAAQNKGSYQYVNVQTLMMPPGANPQDQGVAVEEKP